MQDVTQAGLKLPPLSATSGVLQKMNARKADFAPCGCTAYTYRSVAGIGHVFNSRNVLVKNSVAGFSLAAGSGQKAAAASLTPVQPLTVLHTGSLIQRQLQFPLSNNWNSLFSPLRKHRPLQGVLDGSVAAF